MGVDVSIGIVADSTWIREEASGEVISESLLCVLGCFGLFMDEVDRKFLLEMGKNLVHLWYMG